MLAKLGLKCVFSIVLIDYRKHTEQLAKETLFGAATAGR